MTIIARRSLLLVAVACSGCQSIDNDRLLVGSEALPTFVTPAQRTDARLVQATGPSLTGIERNNWTEAQIVVGTDGVQHHPRWTRAQPAYVKTPRATGLHPTTETALTIDRAAGPHVAEAFAAPFHGAKDVVLLIPRMFTHGPGCVRVSPSEAYERSNTSNRAESPALSPVPAPTQAAPSTGAETAPESAG